MHDSTPETTDGPASERRRYCPGHVCHWFMYYGCVGPLVFSDDERRSAVESIGRYAQEIGEDY